MSITPTTNYMSHDFIDSWMESRTEQTYGNMRDAMDGSNHRADAEHALNKIKGQLAELKTSGGCVSPGFEKEVNDVMNQYGDVPGVTDALRSLSQTLGDAHVASTNGTGPMLIQSDAAISLKDSDIDNCTKAIGDTVDYLGKQDQLGMINLNQLNSQINQTENIASALKDSRNKTAESIINRIG